MVGQRHFICIVVVVLLAFCAVAVEVAPAAQTAFKCEANTVAGAKQFADAHCKETATGDAGFKHVSIAAEVTTSITATNANTVAGTTAADSVEIQGTLAGVETRILCTGESGTGTVVNRSGGGGMWAEWGLVTTYSGCTVTKPSGQGCVVTGSSVTTEALVATNEIQPANKVLFRPSSGTKLATFPISGCSTSALNNNYPLTGSLTATATGGTLSSTEADVTTQNTLKFGGNKAGVGTTMTLKAGSSAISLT